VLCKTARGIVGVGEDMAHSWEWTYCSSCHEDVWKIASEATLLVRAHIGLIALLEML
jgi:hypothetical protein